MVSVYIRRIGLCILLLALMVACRQETVGWPALPQDPQAARELIGKYTSRPANAEPVSVTAESVLELLKKRVGEGTAVGGMQDLVFWIWRRVSVADRKDHSSYILWGTYHDAGAQVRAFGDLVGPLGLPALDAVSVEQFNADGHWPGVAAGEQAGDSALLATYLKKGDRVALEKLLHGQVRENYTGWKYGTLPEFADLLAKARAANRRLTGCDMPLSLQERIDKTGERERLRELHCLLAMKKELAAKPPPHRVAMLWGQGHLAPEGVQRFLPKKAVVLWFHVYGGRFSRQGLESELAGKLAITDPLLIPIDDADANLLVLLPDEHIGARKELKHVSPQTPFSKEERGRLVVTSQMPGTIQIADQRLQVSEKQQTLTLDQGSHVFLFTHPGGLLAGALTMPPDGYLELDLDPEKRFVEVILHRRTR